MEDAHVMNLCSLGNLSLFQKILVFRVFGGSIVLQGSIILKVDKLVEDAYIQSTIKTCREYIKY